MQENSPRKIGIFDTGRGGEFVAEVFRPLFPECSFAVVDDAAHAPYGSRDQDEIQALVVAAVQPLITQGCEIIIVACNTATTIAIAHLRRTFPAVSFVGFEPMTKVAASHTKSGAFMVLATPATLTSNRYQELKSTYAKNAKVIEPDCATWAHQIQAHQVNEVDLSEVASLVDRHDCDLVVLACTHYLALEARLQALLGDRVTILEPSDAVATRLRQLLTEPQPPA